MAQPKTINDLPIEQVKSVYSGRNGKCCCGCSGIHSTDARNIKRIYNLLKNAADVEEGGNHFATVIGSRLYIVYFA